MSKHIPPLHRLFDVQSPQAFEAVCMAVFHYQARHCAIYREYLSLLGIVPETIHRSEDIPFLPIEFFKSHQVISGNELPQVVFSSSGTTGSLQSRHYVTDLTVYQRSFRTAFERFYGRPDDMAILALLPAYAEREGSSLIYMVDDLIKRSRHPLSGYFLYNHGELKQALESTRTSATTTLLIGVTFALLDFVENHPVDFPALTVMETGGMKGRRKEMIREEVHERLCTGFNVSAIHSEYGMTELLSQAYSHGGGLFRCPPWMRIHIRDTNDPFTLLPTGRTGAINIIDLANVHSCAFIATQDLGKIHADGRFEVLGRFDQSDIRGCNLLVQ
ncbi:Acyl-protein synthetase, LuxE [Parapedobacter composti]|uniref:Acyl-protein synthetase, LuxE n=1 Tax=Parapedobacter composti TaxID=623281 RepID=A0A1I1LCZ7_9SPHI|nr:acyl transferase [Parapedobacter composti]SFC70845.1 Acyl-protein synthetase, LuxE [Parapedobacter composti]